MARERQEKNNNSKCFFANYVTISLTLANKKAGCGLSSEHAYKKKKRMQSFCRN